MGRKIKNNADYFSHDNDMRNDEKIKAVRRRFKHDGYSVWNMLLEKLCKADGFTLQYNDLNIELWSGDFEVEPDRLKEMVEYFLTLDLLLLHDGEIFSETMIARFNPLMEKRNKQRGGNSDPKPPIDGISDDENTHTIVKDSIVNNTLKGALMKDFKIEACKPESESFKVMETSKRVYDGFVKALPHNRDLPLVKQIDWVKPIRRLMQDKKYLPEQIIEVAKWSVHDEFWKTVILDAVSLEKNFEKLKAKYHARKVET
jgi:hypothetical protein